MSLCFQNEIIIDSFSKTILTLKIMTCHKTIDLFFLHINLSEINLIFLNSYLIVDLHL